MCTGNSNQNKLTRRNSHPNIYSEAEIGGVIFCVQYSGIVTKWQTRVCAHNKRVRHPLLWPTSSSTQSQATLLFPAGVLAFAPSMPTLPSSFAWYNLVPAPSVV